MMAVDPLTILDAGINFEVIGGGRIPIDPSVPVAGTDFDVRTSIVGTTLVLEWHWNVVHSYYRINVRDGSGKLFRQWRITHEGMIMVARGIRDNPDFPDILLYWVSPGDVVNSAPRPSEVADGTHYLVAAAGKEVR